MAHDEMKELQELASWSDEQDSAKEPVKSPSAVVSVRFNREELERVAETARLKGMKTSEFIRESAIQQSQPSPEESFVVYGITGTGVTQDYPQNRGKAPFAKRTVKSRNTNLVST